MGKLPNCSQKAAVIIGVSSVVAMPMFMAGSAQGTPSSPASPTTTTVVPEPADELEPARTPDLPIENLPVQVPATQQVPVPQKPVYQNPGDIPVSTSSVPDIESPSIQTTMTSPSILRQSPPVISEVPVRQLPRSEQPKDDTPESSDSNLPSQGSWRVPEVIPSFDSRDGQQPPMDYDLPVRKSNEYERDHSDEAHDVDPLPVPLPPNNRDNFPDWGSKPPQIGSRPLLVDDHNPLPHCQYNEVDCLPPPIVPEQNWHHQWLDECESQDHGCQPPENPDIYVENGQHNNVVIVNNVVNQSSTNIYVTNLVTGTVYNFPYVPHGTPYELPVGWCDGVGGSFAWSAGLQGHLGGISFGGGGIFYTNAECSYMPPPPPHAPLIIEAPGYPEYTANEYIEINECSCIYVSNTYIYGYREGEVFVPTSWTPDIVTQPAIEGLPPFITGSNPTEKRALNMVSWTAALSHPLFLIGLSITAIALTVLIFLKRQRVGL